MVLASCVTVCIPEIIRKSVLLSLFYIKEAIHVQFLQINKITVTYALHLKVYQQVYITTSTGSNPKIY